MNIKAVKLALLKMNPDDLKSPKMNNGVFAPPQLPSKKAATQVGNNIRGNQKTNGIGNVGNNLTNLSNVNNITNNNALKLQLSNSISEPKKILTTNRGESRNKKLATISNNNTSNFRTNMSTTNYIPSITSPNNNSIPLKQKSNEIFKFNPTKDVVSPPKMKRYNILNNDSQFSSNYNTERIERVKTPKTPKYFQTNTSGGNSYTSYNNSSKSNEPIDIMSLLSNQNYVPLSLSCLNIQYPYYDSTKSSTKQIHQIKGYAANTYQGLVR
jgi:hypothetical protein